MSLHDLIAKPRCPLVHSIKLYEQDSSGAWQRGNDELLVLFIQGDGQPKHRLQCRRCGHRSSDLPKTVASEWGLLTARYDVLNWRPQNSYQDCTYRDCPEPGREMHHFAPRNTFGLTAENWPVLPLCHGHHVEWHQRMNGYRWNSRTEAAA